MLVFVAAVGLRLVGAKCCGARGEWQGTKTSRRAWSHPHERPTVTIPNDMVAHRNRLHEQFIPYYDEASSRWFDMVDNKKIPLTGNRKEVRRAYLDRIVQDLMNATGGPMSEQEERMLRRMEEEEWDELDETLADFESALPPTDKKKIH